MESGGFTLTDITVAPEPGTFSMLLSGMLGLGLLVGMSRRRRST
jgi:MYXO-CTERM domain-containing protein